MNMIRYNNILRLVHDPHHPPPTPPPPPPHPPAPTLYALGTPQPPGLTPMKPGAYICPAYKSPLPQLLLPTSKTQGGIPLHLSSCCLCPCSRLCGISPRLL